MRQQNSKTLPRIARPFWFCLGAVALFLGVVGVVLPILPTTPFVILAAFCFGKSSSRVYRLLLENRIFGPIIADWKTHGAIATKYKMIALFMMVGAILLSIAMGVRKEVLALQVLVMGSAAGYVLSRPSR